MEKMENKLKSGDYSSAPLSPHYYAVVVKQLWIIYNENNSFSKQNCPCTFLNILIFYWFPTQISGLLKPVHSKCNCSATNQLGNVYVVVITWK